MMSFVGCIGTLMDDSGLKEVLEVVYAQNTVTHMLSGKAISRAIRGHLLVYAALYGMLASRSCGIPLTTDAADVHLCYGREIAQVSKVLDDILQGEKTI